MINGVREFFEMGGYAFYVWGAYGFVIIFLLTQWFFSFKRWRQYRRKKYLGNNGQVVKHDE